jgi:hypothetical protein
MRTLLIVAVVAALLLGCQQSPPANPLSPPMGPDARALKQEGDHLARSRDWAGAAAKYQMALNRESSNLELRLAYGITLSHLDRRDETAEQFRWVINNSQPGSHAFAMARTWLVEAGELLGLPAATAAPMPDAAQAGNDTTPKGGLRGTTSWPGVTARERLVPLRITLSGEDKENHDVTLGRRFRLGEPYRLSDARPGKYRLRAVAIDQNVELWDKQVVVEAGKETILDLSATDSSVSTREFPPSN